LTELQARAEKAGVDLSRLPRHIAIIMDGNGRWANRRGLGRLLGHREGYMTLRQVVKDCGDLGVDFLTVYAFSAENWRRPESEVSGLMKLIEGAMMEQIANLKQSNVRCRIIGRRSQLPASLQEALSRGEAETASCTGLTFTLAINYGGRAEIVDAVQGLIREGVSADAVTEELVSSRMYDADAPDPDLMIRTAGEMRWSNFLIWQAAYAELFVTDLSWPEFDAQELIRAVLAYQSRTRKFGGLADPV